MYFPYQHCPQLPATDNSSPSRVLSGGEGVKNQYGVTFNHYDMLDGLEKVDVINIILTDNLSIFCPCQSVEF